MYRIKLVVFRGESRCYNKVCIFGCNTETDPTGLPVGSFFDSLQRDSIATPRGGTGPSSPHSPRLDSLAACDLPRLFGPFIRPCLHDAAACT